MKQSRTQSNFNPLNSKFRHGRPVQGGVGHLNVAELDGHPDMLPGLFGDHGAIAMPIQSSSPMQN